MYIYACRKEGVSGGGDADKTQVYSRSRQWRRVHIKSNLLINIDTRWQADEQLERRIFLIPDCESE